MAIKTRGRPLFVGALVVLAALATLRLVLTSQGMLQGAASASTSDRGAGRHVGGDSDVLQSTVAATQGDRRAGGAVEPPRECCAMIPTNVL
jgi:hypothetical protein